MFAWLTLLADAAQEAIGGGAISGWTGTALLGSVLSWLLLKHLPEKDRQIRDLIDASRKDSKEERELFSRIIAQTHTDHLRMAEALTANTAETRALAQETRALSGSVGNLVNKVTST